MGIYESSFGIRVARVMMVLCLPVAILLGFAYLYPAMVLWQALMWAFGVTWLMDQVGSFAMFYRRQQMLCWAEKWFFRLNVLSTVGAKLYLISDWYDSSACWRVALGAGLLAAFGTARIVENLWDTHFRLRPRIHWADAQCVYQCQRLLDWLKRDKEQLPSGTEHFQAQAPPSGGEEAEVFEVKIPEPAMEDQAVNEEIHRTVEAIMAEKNGMTVVEQEAETVVVQCSFLELMRQQNVERAPDAATVEWPGSGQKAIEMARQQTGETVKARPPTRTAPRLKTWNADDGKTISPLRSRQEKPKKYFGLAVVMGSFLGQAGIWLGTRSLATLIRTNYWLAIALTGGLMAIVAGFLMGCLALVGPRQSQVWMIWTMTALTVSGGAAYIINSVPNWQFVELALGGALRAYRTVDLTFGVMLGLTCCMMLRYARQLCWAVGRKRRTTSVGQKFVSDWKRGFEQVDSWRHVLKMAYGFGR